MKRRLVTSHADIRVGLLLEVVPCLDCGSIHQFMVLSGPVEGWASPVSDEDMDNIPPNRCWVVAPEPSCWEQVEGEEDLFNPQNEIAAQALYIVETGVNPGVVTTRVLEKT